MTSSLVVVTRARSRLVQERVWCGGGGHTAHLTPALGGSNPDNRPGLTSTLHLESWNSGLGQCRVSSGVTASTHLLLVGRVCPVSMLVSHSGAGMAQWPRCLL